MTTLTMLVPCYNYAAYLRDAVESVLSQPVDLRVVILDDASSDGSAAIGRQLAIEDSRVTFHGNPVNLKHIANYNQGLAKVDTPLVGIVSADDMVMPNALQRSVAMLLADPTLVMAYGRALYFTDGLSARTIGSGAARARVWQHNHYEGFADQEHGTPVAELAKKLPAMPRRSSTRQFFRQNKFVNRPHMSGVIMRTAALHRVGLFRPELPHAGDFEMWLRLAAAGPVGYIDQFQIAARMHQSNMSSGYYADGASDFQQRALALRLIESEVGHGLPKGLMVEMRRGLAVSILRAASGAPATAAGETLYQQLLDLALSLDPRATASGLGWLLVQKRRMQPGLRAIVPRSLRRLALDALHLP